MMAVVNPRLFHVSEDPGIKIFRPRPSPSHFDGINKNVVFAISEKLLHNYLLPRDCPRVTFYSKPETNAAVKEKFLGTNAAEFVIAIEENWRQKVKQATLYCYEFPTESFAMLDEGAGYYISYVPVTPFSVTPITNIFGELASRNVELRFMTSLQTLAEEVSKSSLQFSIIRMRNAIL
jgi:hypothetical protein